ncbi:cytochrome b N-terminal domain-containing protein [Erythrobacter sanguineus]|uniref:cytochrome b N-terminal domain-containing protein n=1 Tax=Erythrobacter sanguineus TaxID=198312 RepID=UPI000A37EB8E
MNKTTLTQFFTFHFLFPFIITTLTIIHLIFLHNKKTNNPINLKNNYNKTPFHIYYTTKNTIKFILLITTLFNLTLLFPNTLKNPKKFIPTNPLITPPHIQPK